MGINRCSADMEAFNVDLETGANTFQNILNREALLRETEAMRTHPHIRKKNHFRSKKRRDNRMAAATVHANHRLETENHLKNTLRMEKSPLEANHLERNHTETNRMGINHSERQERERMEKETHTRSKNTK